MRDMGYLVEVLKSIIKDDKRAELLQIQKYLCCVLLARFDDIQKDYKNLKNYKHLKDVIAFLALVFDIEYNIMKDILDKLDIYKNYNNKDIQSCLNVKLGI